MNDASAPGKRKSLVLTHRRGSGEPMVRYGVWVWTPGDVVGDVEVHRDECSFHEGPGVRGVAERAYRALPYREGDIALHVRLDPRLGHAQLHSELPWELLEEWRRLEPSRCAPGEGTDGWSLVVRGRPRLVRGDEWAWEALASAVKSAVLGREGWWYRVRSRTPGVHRAEIGVGDTLEREDEGGFAAWGEPEGAALLRAYLDCLRRTKDP